MKNNNDTKNRTETLQKCINYNSAVCGWQLASALACAHFASEPRLCIQPLLLLIKNMANDVNLRRATLNSFSA